MKELKLQIFSENEDFNFHLEEFLLSNSLDFNKIKKRISNLKTILDDMIDNQVEGKFKIKATYQDTDYTHDIFGETYEQSYCDAISLSRATHIVKSIYIDGTNSKYFADIVILNTPNGNNLLTYPENFLILRPVYSSKYQQILTFNIDINRSEVYKRILSRPAA